MPRSLHAPSLSFAPELLLKAQGSGLGMKCAIFDADGVLTDGRLYVGADGESVKAFNVLDGHGLKLLVRAGITPVIISGRDSMALRRRVADLGLVHAHYGVQDKLATAEAQLAALGIGWADTAAIGDDWPDLPLLSRCALACASANAHVEVKALADHVTCATGGHGAAREFCDLLLIASGRYAALLQDHLRSQAHSLDSR
jgi:3-deoxy-D-manno-octulosonate 8-phosphate phosphatase (KDO 8-P phosphatase)